MASQNQVAFRKWWWLIPIVVAVGVGGAFASLKLVQKEYQATCRLFVSVPAGTTPGESFQAAQFGQARVAAYLELIKGDRVAEGAIKELKLDMAPHDLAQRIDARADAESVVMNVSVTDSQPERSADLANAVCTQFLAVAADAEGPLAPINVRMIENAAAPQYAVSPSAKRYLAVGALTGLLAGMGLVITLGQFSPKNREQPKSTQQHVEAVDETAVAPARRDSDSIPSGSGSHRHRS